MAPPTNQKTGTRQVLKSSKQRLTVHPTPLLDLLRHSNGHLDAHEFHRQSRENHSGISLSTIYRNLQLFRKHFRKLKKTADAM
jgi:Fe2+ or Zn2+ uptake regulation protein